MIQNFKNFKFKISGLVLGITLKFDVSMEEGLKLKFRAFSFSDNKVLLTFSKSFLSYKGKHIFPTIKKLDLKVETFLCIKFFFLLFWFSSNNFL